jgi:hypothetical protein
MDSLHSVDIEFADAVRRAGRALTASKGQNPEEAGLALANLLRSGAELGPGEREMLAELVTGQWRRRVGPPSRAGERRRVREAVAALRDHYASKGEGRSLAACAEEWAEANGKDVDTVLNIVRRPESNI